MATNKCRSPFCITDAEGRKGREFEQPENATGLQTIWCPQCIKIGSQLQFFSSQTAAMIRRKYTEMRIEDLPPEVGNMLTAYTRDILNELGEEL